MAILVKLKSNRPLCSLDPELLLARHLLVLKQPCMCILFVLIHNNVTLQLQSSFAADASSLDTASWRLAGPTAREWQLGQALVVA